MVEGGTTGHFVKALPISRNGRYEHKLWVEREFNSGGEWSTHHRLCEWPCNTPFTKQSRLCLTLYCLAWQICDAVQKFWFKFKKGSSKEIPISVATIWVGRRKEPILDYVPKNYEKNNSGSKGLRGSTT